MENRERLELANRVQNRIQNLDKKISDFLNMPIEILQKAPTYDEMKKAVEKEDFFELHMLGYEVSR